MSLVSGIQDLGGAGITCATSETASRGEAGMDVDVTAIHARENNMEPFELMTSESQERMLAIIKPEDLAHVEEISARWEIQASVIGRVTGTGQLRILDGFDGDVLASLPASTLHDGPGIQATDCATCDLLERRAKDASQGPVDSATIY